MPIITSYRQSNAQMLLNALSLAANPATERVPHRSVRVTRIADPVVRTRSSSTSCYEPHQGARERARRLRQKQP